MRRFRRIHGENFERLLVELNRELQRSESVLDRELPLVGHHFWQDNVAASQTDVSLETSGGPANKRYISLRNAYVRKIGVHTNDARTAGTLTVTPRIDFTALGSGAVLDGTNTTTHVFVYDKVPANFIAEGGVLDCEVTTDGSWAPTTADITVMVYLEATGE